MVYWVDVSADKMGTRQAARITGLSSDDRDELSTRCVHVDGGAFGGRDFFLQRVEAIRDFGWGDFAQRVEPVGKAGEFLAKGVVQIFTDAHLLAVRAAQQRDLQLLGLGRIVNQKVNAAATAPIKEEADLEIGDVGLVEGLNGERGQASAKCGMDFLGIVRQPLEQIRFPGYQRAESIRPGQRSFDLKN